MYAALSILKRVSFPTQNINETLSVLSAARHQQALTLLLLTPGEALDLVLRTSFSEASGGRPDFPKALLLVTDGRSDDQLEVQARQLQGRGVEIFVLGGSSHLLLLFLLH